MIKKIIVLKNNILGHEGKYVSNHVVIDLKLK